HQHVGVTTNVLGVAGNVRNGQQVLEVAQDLGFVRLTPVPRRCRRSRELCGESRRETQKRENYEGSELHWLANISGRRRERQQQELVSSQSARFADDVFDLGKKEFFLWWRERDRRILGGDA